MTTKTPWPNFDQTCALCGTPIRVARDHAPRYESKYDYLTKAYAEVMALLYKERLKYEEEIKRLKDLLGPYEDPETKKYTETGI